MCPPSPPDAPDPSAKPAGGGLWRALERFGLGSRTRSGMHRHGVWIGVSWPSEDEPRWQRDVPVVRAALQRAGAHALERNACGRREQQRLDVLALVEQGVQALIVTAVDAAWLAKALQETPAAELPIVAYDRYLPMSGAVYVSFDNEAVGRLQAEALLQRVPRGNYLLLGGPLVDPNCRLVHDGQLAALEPALQDGRVRVVADVHADDWSGAQAEALMTATLDTLTAPVDAVLAFNDTLAGAAATALARHGYARLPPIAGQDAEAPALARLRDGRQAVTVWKDVRRLGDTAVTLAVALAQGWLPPGLDLQSAWSPDQKLMLVRALLLPPQLVTVETMPQVVDAPAAAATHP